MGARLDEECLLLLCPPHRKTSPKSTSTIVAFAIVDEAFSPTMWKSKAIVDAWMGGRDCRHVPSLEAVVVNDRDSHSSLSFDLLDDPAPSETEWIRRHRARSLGAMVVWTVAPGCVNPQMVAEAGACWSTICEPSVDETNLSVSGSCDLPSIW